MHIHECLFLDPTIIFSVKLSLISPFYINIVWIWWTNSSYGQCTKLQKVTLQRWRKGRPALFPPEPCTTLSYCELMVRTLLLFFSNLVKPKWTKKDPAKRDSGRLTLEALFVTSVDPKDLRRGERRWTSWTSPAFLLSVGVRGVNMNNTSTLTDTQPLCVFAATDISICLSTHQVIIMTPKQNSSSMFHFRLLWCCHHVDTQSNCRSASSRILMAAVMKQIILPLTLRLWFFNTCSILLWAFTSVKSSYLKSEFYSNAPACNRWKQPPALVNRKTLGEIRIQIFCI